MVSEINRNHRNDLRGGGLDTGVQLHLLFLRITSVSVQSYLLVDSFSAMKTSALICSRHLLYAALSSPNWASQSGFQDDLNIAFPKVLTS